MTASSHYSLQWIWNLGVIWTFATQFSIIVTTKYCFSQFYLSKKLIWVCTRVAACCCRASANWLRSQFYLSKKLRFALQHAAPQEIRIYLTSLDFIPICVLTTWPDRFAQVAMLEDATWQKCALKLYSWAGLFQRGLLLLWKGTDDLSDFPFSILYVHTLTKTENGKFEFWSFMFP